MTTIQEKAQNLIQERNELIARYNEINGALKTLDELVQAETEQENDGATTSDDEFSAFGITYQVSDDLTIGYTTSEREFGDKTQDEESVSLNVSYTTGGMTIGAAMVSMDNMGGSTAAVDDIDGYAIDVSFAF